jgi:hypothetical protein
VCFLLAHDKVTKFIFSSHLNFYTLYIQQWYSMLKFDIFLYLFAIFNY